MKALIFDKQGIDNLQIRDVAEPEIGDYDVLVKVACAGVNPIDYNIIDHIPNVAPMPHIPGVEFTGTIQKTGIHAKNHNVGDRVTVYSRTFDGTCQMCIKNLEFNCQNGGMIGRIKNGGYAEYACVPAKNAFKIPDSLNWETAASLPVAALTPYHAIHRAKLEINQTFAVYGASGNTGLFATQLAKQAGANVIAISSKSWVKDFGADQTVSHENAPQKIRELTDGRMADVVMNSIGTLAWQNAFDSVADNGTLVLFGTLTGAKADIPLDQIYNRQIKIVGSTAGTRAELAELIANADKLKTKVWKTYTLENGKEALQQLHAKERDGRILITP